MGTRCTFAEEKRYTRFQVLNVIKENTADGLVLRFSGEIAEGANFAQLIGPISGNVVLHCKEITRINSMGVKSWIQFFQAAVTKGAKLRFVECSPAVVEQINLIMNFSCGGTVESIFIPYACTSCKKSLAGLFRVEDLRKGQLKLPDLPCSKCGGKAVFDDILEEYFRFIAR
jgi:anti-anti-sigma regulatory factor